MAEFGNPINLAGLKVDMFQGGSASYRLSNAPSPNSVLVFVNGQFQRPVYDYEISGVTLNFSSLTPAATGNNMYNVSVFYMAVALLITQPGTNTVDAGQLTPNLTAILQNGSWMFGNDSGTQANAYVVNYTSNPLINTSGKCKFYTNRASTGAATLQVNGGSVLSIVGQAGQPLQNGEVFGYCEVMFAGTYWILMESQGNEQIADAKASHHPVSLGQGDARYLPIGYGTYGGLITSSQVGAFNNGYTFTIAGTATLPPVAQGLFFRFIALTNSVISTSPSDSSKLLYADRNITAAGMQANAVWEVFSDGINWYVFTIAGEYFTGPATVPQACPPVSQVFNKNTNPLAAVSVSQVVGPTSGQTITNSSGSTQLLALALGYPSSGYTGYTASVYLNGNATPSLLIYSYSYNGAWVYPGHGTILIPNGMQYQITHNAGTALTVTTTTY